MYRRVEQKLMALINSRGAYLLFNPARSPDLNVIEKFWDVATADAAHKVKRFTCAANGGIPRRFGKGDLMMTLKDVRLTTRAYTDMLARGMEGDQANH